MTRWVRLAWPIAAWALTAATIVSITRELSPAVRVPLVAVTLLALPGVGLWRGLRLAGPAVSIAGLIVLTSIALDVVAAESLLLAGHLHAVSLMAILAAIGVLGTFRDLAPGRRTEGAT